MAVPLGRRIAADVAEFAPRPDAGHSMVDGSARASYPHSRRSGSLQEETPLPKTPFELDVALRYLRPRRSEPFVSLIALLSALGICLGVASIVVVFTVSSGFEEVLREKILSVTGHVLVQSAAGSLRDPEEVAREIAGIDGVTEATPYAMGQVLVVAKGGIRGAVLRGGDLGDRGVTLRMREVLSEGSLAELDGRAPALLLGRELARELKVAPGDAVQVLVPATAMPRARAFRVAGILSMGQYTYDASVAFASLPIAQELLELGERATGIQVRVTNVDDADAMASTIREKLAGYYLTASWMDMNRPIFSAFALQKAVLVIILSLIVVVAAFNVASTLILMVLGKTRAIGILKAMGSTGFSIRRIFAFQGLVMGVLGAAAGLLLGVGICALLERYPIIDLPSDIYLLERLPVAWRPLVLVSIAGGSVALATLAAFYPAWRASRLDPVDILRSEG
jgi:lipoprotein-releasing system permease protein